MGRPKKFKGQQMVRVTVRLPKTQRDEFLARAPAGWTMTDVLLGMCDFSTIMARQIDAIREQLIASCAAHGVDYQNTRSPERIAELVRLIRLGLEAEQLKKRRNHG